MKENIDIDIDIDKTILENINIAIDFDKDNLGNIDMDIHKDYLENIDIDKNILENIYINIDIYKDILGKKIHFFSRFKTCFMLFRWNIDIDSQYIGIFWNTDKISRPFVRISISTKYR